MKKSVSRFLRVIVSLAVVLLLSASSRPLWACGFDFSGWYVSPGINVGATDQDGARFFLGGEVSVFHLNDDMLWVGSVADAYWTAKANGLRYTVGGEIGLGPVGLEASYLGERFSDHYSPGMRFGLVFSLIGVVSAYFRYGHLFDSRAQSDFAEGGLLVKIPLRFIRRHPSHPRVEPQEPPIALPPPPDSALLPLQQPSRRFAYH